MFFVFAATISGGMAAGAWVLQYGGLWAASAALLAGGASALQAVLVLHALRRREQEAAPTLDEQADEAVAKLRAVARQGGSPGRTCAPRRGKAAKDRSRAVP
ncbi:hypothetical protein [Methylobacterium crusticola]|uniref:hypothetical protein n=1 Tax=Methylobacterium crusticola TaxID=1697972 RepID=UPI000FFB1E3D|nr:hypothetical protein [Methylobacterium crusticola]